MRSARLGAGGGEDKQSPDVEDTGTRQPRASAHRRARLAPPAWSERVCLFTFRLENIQMETCIYSSLCRREQLRKAGGNLNN